MAKPCVLLVYPYIEDFAAYDHFAKPLGLWMMASLLKPYADVWYVNALDRSVPGLNMRFKPDGTGHFYRRVVGTPSQIADIPRRWKRYGMPEEMFLQRLQNLPERPDWVFVSSGMTYWYRGLQYTIELIRRVFPRARVVLGGMYAALLPEHAKGVGADVVVPFQQPSRVRDVLSGVMGLSLDWGSMIPDYTMTSEYGYAPLLLAMGCVFRCQYCASPLLSPFLPFDMQGVLGVFDWLYGEKGVRHFAFYDDALLFEPRKRLQVLLSHVLEKGYAPAFHTPNGLHIRYLDEETALLMRATGFVDVRLSLESVDEDFHVSHGTKTKTDEFLRALEMLYRAGFERRHIRVYTLVGIPGQTLSSVERTMEFVFRHGAIPMLAYYSPIPGTADFLAAARHTDLSDPLFHNNTVYLYRSGLDVGYINYLHQKEIAYRHQVEATGVI